MTKSVNMMELVVEFMTAFNMTEKPDGELWRKLVEEEHEELKEAMTAFIKESIDFAYVSLGAVAVTAIARLRDGHDPYEVSVEAGELVEAVCATVSVLENVFGKELINAAILEVHRSNMSKLGPDGKPVLREDGKVLKGPNYSPADIRKLLA
jgi:hypothetical protein